MIEPIRSYEELQNSLALGLDLYVLKLSISGNKEVMKLYQPYFIKGIRGVKFGTRQIFPDYLIRWGITDSDNHPNIKTYGHVRYLIFNHAIEAEIWIKRGYKI